MQLHVALGKQESFLDFPFISCSALNAGLLDVSVYTQG